MASVLVLFGGKSAEHEVSCSSAQAVAEALRIGGHQVCLVGIDRKGGWHLTPDDRQPLEAVGPEVRLEVPSGVLRGLQRDQVFEVVFPVLHGPFGEDGTMQGLFETVGIPYVGAGVLGSAVSMDKAVAKRLLREAGLSVAAWVVVRRDGFDNEPGQVASLIEDRIGFPNFVKPAALGSSVGITKVHDVTELKDAIQLALEHGEKAMVEQAIAGREIEVGVLEGPRTSVPGEVIPNAEWYDYRAKYLDTGTQLLVPAPLSEAEAVTARRLAALAFEALEGSGLARVDLLYEQAGRGFLVNELNTMPGFTPRSMFPLLWQASGMSYPELCDELVQLALARGSSGAPPGFVRD